jgi:hypothetical protein
MPVMDEDEVANLEQISPYASLISNIIKKNYHDPTGMVGELTHFVRGLEDK